MGTSLRYTIRQISFLTLNDNYLDESLNFLTASSVLSANIWLTWEYDCQVSMLNTALSGIEWNRGQKVALQHPL